MAKDGEREKRQEEGSGGRGRIGDMQVLLEREGG